MAIELRLSSVAAPKEVLAAIRESTREWRESVIPDDLRDRGILQVASRVEGVRFKLYYERRYYRRGGDPLRLEGAVRPADGGGSDIVARCGASRVGLWAASVPGLFAVVSLISGRLAEWWLWTAVAGLFVAVRQMQDAWFTPEHPEAAYLVKRLRSAVDLASSGRAQAT